MENPVHYLRHWKIVVVMRERIVFVNKGVFHGSRRIVMRFLHYLLAGETLLENPVNYPCKNSCERERERV